MRQVEEFAAQWLGDRPAAQAAYTRTQLAGPPLADPAGRAVQLSFHPDRCGEVDVVARPYLLPLGKPSVGTTHGTPHDYDTHVPVLAYGRGVPRLQKRTERVRPLVVAPIVCRALGIDQPPGLSERLPTVFD